MSTENKVSGNKTEPMIWVDMEMSGLKPDSDRILEIAMIVTDAHLNIIATAPVWVVHQTDEVLAGMDAWNTGTHTKSEDSKWQDYQVKKKNQPRMEN